MHPRMLTLLSKQVNKILADSLPAYPTFQLDELTEELINEFQQFLDVLKQGESHENE